jgi:two-component system phosphate regulon sensor histidine kinase PhoR
MKNRTLRLIILLGIVSVTGIIAIQIYWLKRAFDWEDAQFNHNVNIALKNVADSLVKANHSENSVPNPVYRYSSNYYFVAVNDRVDAGLLQHYLQQEFARKHLTIDFEYCIYDCEGDRMLYGNYVNFDNRKKDVTPRNDLPKWKDKVYYFSVFFPEKDAHLAGKMSIWIFSSLLLMSVLAFFGYAIFVILKQKRLSEIQKDFINNMTHEFKTPIATIMVSADVLKKPEIINQPERLRNYAGIISQEATRLKNQVERVLQAALLDNKKLKIQKNAVNINEVIAETVVNMESLVNGRGGKLHLNLNANNPMIEADALHLRNILGNLLDNALKYCRNEPEITVSSRNLPKGIEIQVQDNGIGIPAEYQKLIFERFYRIPTGNLHDVKGFGLGLYYVKTVIKAHKGKIFVKSKPGQGSVFTIELPF